MLVLLHRLHEEAVLAQVGIAKVKLGLLTQLIHEIAATGSHDAMGCIGPPLCDTGKYYVCGCGDEGNARKPTVAKRALQMSCTCVHLAFSTSLPDKLDLGISRSLFPS